MGRLLLSMLLLLGSLSSPASWAQINIERQRIQAEQEGFSGSLEASFTQRTGNSESLLSGLGARLAWARDPWLWFLLGDLRLGSSRGNTFLNRGFFHLRGIREHSPSLAWEGFVQHAYDQFARLRGRSLVGSGPRWTLVGEDEGALHLGIAYMVEWERLRVSPGDPDAPSTRAHRISSYLSGRLPLGKTLDVENTLYVQPRIGNPSDVRVLNEASLQWKGNAPLGFRIGFTLRYDGEPPSGVKKLDTEWVTRLTWEF